MVVKIKTTKGAHVDGVKLLVYGGSGVGKTTLISTAENPIIISSESGLLALADYDIPVIEINSIKDLEEAYKHVATSEEYDTICLDSISDIAETVLAEYKGQFSDGRQAYGKLGDTMNKIIRDFRDLKGKHVYFTAKEGKLELNGVTAVQPSMPGQTLTTNLPYYFDAVLRLEANKKGERVLHTASTFTQVCKDRSGKLDKTEQPNLAQLINKLKGK